MEKSWKESIIRVLKESVTALHYTEISEKILSYCYYQSAGAMP
jgi:hypothetical protein